MAYREIWSDEPVMSMCAHWIGQENALAEDTERPNTH